MSIYINFDLDNADKNIENKLLPYSEQEFKKIELLNLLDEQFQKQKLSKCLEAFMELLPNMKLQMNVISKELQLQKINQQRTDCKRKSAEKKLLTIML